MEVKTTTKKPLSVKADLLIIPATKTRKSCLNIRGLLKEVFDEKTAKGLLNQRMLKKQESILITLPEGPARLLIKGYDDDMPLWDLPEFFAGIAKQAKGMGAGRVSILLPETKHINKWVRHAISGFVLALEEITSLKKKEEDDYKIKDLTFIQPKGIDLQKDIEQAMIISEAKAYARRLVHTPPNILTPDAFVQEARNIAWENNLDIKVMRRKELTRMGANLLLAVGSGSAYEPALVHISYIPENPVKKVALVGKGITFDAGGYHLKPRGYLEDMKGDMAGAGAVIAAIAAVARLKLPVEVHAIAAVTDNLISSNSMLPGSVYTALNKKTVEVYDTDAEGRLVLADALSYVDQLNPDVIIDLATLTGSCVVALGEDLAGLFTEDDTLAKAIEAAGEDGAERVWRLPMERSIRKKLDSAVADIKNIGGRWGGAIQGAWFLKEFVENKHWAHIDIAGPALKEEGSALSPKGGTGFGVALLLEYLLRLS